MSVKSAFDRVPRNSTQLAILFLDNLVWPILLITFLVFSIQIPEVFSSWNNIQFILYSSAALAMIVLAEAICLLSGNFDLSVGSIAGFSAMFTALFITTWFPNTSGILGIVLILAVGGTIGLLNGISVGIFDVNPFLQTLAFFIIFRGLVTVLSTRSITGLPDSYLYLGRESIGGVPVAIFAAVFIYVAMWFFLRYTRTGLAIYSVGGDKESAREAGIDTTKIIILVYVLSGMLSALGGLFYTGFLGSATTTLAQDTVFPAFAAAVIGGISLFGGRGNVVGAFGGVLLLGTVEAGLTMIGIEATLVNTVNGFVLLFAILLFTFGERYRQRVLTS